MPDLISIEDLSRREIEDIFSSADHIQRSPDDFRRALGGKVVCTLFFESSTRTRWSFEAAAHRLGARVLSVADMNTRKIKTWAWVHKWSSLVCTVFMPRPSAITKIEPSTTRGIELAIWM